MDIQCAIIHYQTPDLLETAVRSFKTHYPDCALILLDNGSKDGSAEQVRVLAEEYPSTELICMDENIYHGPAMDHIMRNVAESELVFFLDSDTETRSSGFLEEMAALLSESGSHYGAGEVVQVNKRGFKSTEEGCAPILLTPYMLLRRSMYLDLPPFIHHGQPTLHNFRAANEKGYHLVNYKVSDHVDHLWRGTADRFGYGLGWSSKWDYLMNKLGL